MKTLRFLLLLAACALPGLYAGIAENIVRERIHGIDVLTLPTGVKNVVTLKGTLPLGHAAAPADNPALAYLTGSMLDKGTVAHDKFAIAGQLESVGAALTFGVGTETLAINGKCLTKDVPLVLALLAEQLRSPAFSAEEFDKVKKHYIGTLRQALDNTNTQAADAFTRAVYPLGHPNRKVPTTELIEAVERTTLDEVKAFHAEYYGPAHLVLILVGDVDATAVGTDILGGGFSARLMGNVRDKEGLTYGIYGFMTGDNLRDGDWRIWANFSPDLLDQGIVSTRRELDKWHREGVTAAELAQRKSGLSGDYKVGLSTTDGMAGAILNTLQRGYELTWLDEYPAALHALTLDQVNGVIKKHLDPAKMVLIKAGTVTDSSGK